MQLPERGLAALLGGLWLAGCATSALDMAPARSDQPWAPATDADGVILAGAPPGLATAQGFVLPGNPALARLPETPGLNDQKIYALPELIDLAESHNPAARIAWEDARHAALAAGIAESAFLPSVTATVIGGYQASSGTKTALGTSYSSNPSLDGTVSAVSLRWLLFDFGQRRAVVDAAKQGSAMSNIAFTAVHQALIHAVSVAFYDHAAAQARLATARQSVADAKAVQAAAEARGRHGEGTVTEIAEARESTAQSGLALVQAQGATEDTYVALLTAMGVSPLTKIRIASVSGRMISPRLEAPVKAIVAAALARRPDVQSAYAAEKASLANVRAAMADFRPKIFLSATGTYATGSLDVTSLPSGGQQPPTVNITGSHAGGSIFAGISIPLYEGGIRNARLAQADAEAGSAEAKVVQVQEDAVRQIVLAGNALHTSLSAYTAAQALQHAAQTTFESALAAYSHGIGSITEVTLSQTRLLQAKNGATNAYSSALSAAATLALATGSLGMAPE